ncbi:MAG: hypothetical protein HY996_08110 [Micrococcales bacterium]|nr:hypothetical protein [Micrococcales bacterium]
MSDERTRAGAGSTVVAVLLAVIVGLFVGGITSFTHRQWPLSLGSVRLPLGLLVGIAIVAAVVIGIRLAFRSRIVALGAAVGVLAAIAVLASRGPGGAVVILQDWVGWTWVIAPAAIAAVTVTRPRRRRHHSVASGADRPAE